jgi:hypothetical protein
VEGLPAGVNRSICRGTREARRKFRCGKLGKARAMTSRIAAWRPPIRRSATRSATTLATRRSTGLGCAGTTARDRHQEDLWAQCLAAQPELMADIAAYVEAARTRLIESPPLSPQDDTADETGAKIGSKLVR